VPGVKSFYLSEEAEATYLSRQITIGQSDMAYLTYLSQSRRKRLR